MSVWWNFRRWLVLFLLRIAFSWRRVPQSRSLVSILRFLFPSENGWINADSRGTWIAEDIAGAKKEAIADRVAASDYILLWIPGGGFRFDLSPLYTHTFKNWIRALEADKNIHCSIFVAKYRKSPEHQFPAAVEDIRSTYQWLLDTMNVPASKILIGGDDAGAAIAIDLIYLHKIQFEGAIFASPYTGLEAGGESWRANLDNDYITAAAVDRMEESYIPSEGDQPFTYLPERIELGQYLPRRMLIFVGGREVLLDEAGYLASRARQGGVNVTMIQSPEQVHLWSILGPVIVPDNRVYQDSVDHFVRWMSLPKKSKN